MDNHINFTPSQPNRILRNIPSQRWIIITVGAVEHVKFPQPGFIPALFYFHFLRRRPVLTLFAKEASSELTLKILASFMLQVIQSQAPIASRMPPPYLL